ncbi:MAG: EAL domain-containing response regulator [Methylococcales bacterium]|nr:EAL domain-containing response regulator [Methylococcales bacterium]
MTESTQLCKIFIVDDDQQQAHLMHEMAKAAELETLVFTSSTDFLKSTITKHDIVVLDLKMPGKDGIEIMRELAFQNIKPYFILVSGFDERVLHSAKQLAESKQLNVISTLTKPIGAKNFINLLNKTFIECNLKKQQQINIETATELLNTGKDSNTNVSDVISIEELKLAIRNHEFIIHFQPKVSINDLKLNGAEALLRWQHPTRGLVLPKQFILLAEKHNLMNLLTEEVLHLVIKDYKIISDNNLNVMVSINLSAQNINDLSMPEKLEALVKHYGIEPESFMLEINESALMNEVTESLDIFNRLRMKGFSLSIDDFGTGYSSLVKLCQAPFTELKIDQSFITKMTKDKDAKAVVRICILLAKELNMQTVAEGIENKEMWDQLKQLGCDIAQGDLISKPMPVENFIKWVSNRALKGYI